MKQLLQISIRNLWEHRAKSIIMIVLIAIGVGILLTGNSIFYTSTEYLNKVFVESYTGDITITGIAQKKGYVATLFGVHSRGPQVSFGENLMPYLPSREKIEAKLRTMPQVKSFTKSAVGTAMLSYDNIPEDWEENSDKLGKIIITSFGIDSSDYWKTFDSIEMIEGAIPADSQKPFILLNAGVFPKNFEDYYKRPLKVGDTILVRSFDFVSGHGNTAEVTVAGFFRPKTADGVMEKLAYMDITSVRAVQGMTAGAAVAEQIPDSIDLMLSEKSDDDLFLDDPDIEDAAVSDDFDMSAVDSLLGDTSMRDKLNMPDEDAWHHITVKLHNSSDTAAVIQELTDWFAEEKIDGRAVNWVKAAQQHTDTLYVFRQFFTIVLIIFAVVLFLVIMNTMVVSVIERTREIGTMRAIGAGKGFVRALFLTETTLLSIIGVSVGLVLTSAIIAVLNAADITITNSLFMALLGKHFNVSIDFLSALKSLAMVLVAGFAANLYPMRLALRVSPLKAMQTN